MIHERRHVEAIALLDVPNMDSLQPPWPRHYCAGGGRGSTALCAVVLVLDTVDTFLQLIRLMLERTDVGHTELKILANTHSCFSFQFTLLELIEFVRTVGLAGEHDIVRKCRRMRGYALHDLNRKTGALEKVVKIGKIDCRYAV
jgi:hypothetical protein